MTVHTLLFIDSFYGASLDLVLGFYEISGSLYCHETYLYFSYFLAVFTNVVESLLAIVFPATGMDPKMRLYSLF